MVQHVHVTKDIPNAKDKYKHPFELYLEKAISENQLRRERLDNDEMR